MKMQRLETDKGEGYPNQGGFLPQGGGSFKKKILLGVAAVLAALAAIAVILFVALGGQTAKEQLKITYKVTLTVGDQRGNKLGDIVIGVFGEHVPVTAYNFVALANHTIDKEPGSRVVGFGYRGSMFSRVSQKFKYFQSRHCDFHIWLEAILEY